VEGVNAPATAGFSLDTPYELVTSSDLKSVFQGGGWEDFYKVHPDSGGYISLSPVGLMRQRPSLWFTWDIAVAGGAAAGSFTSSRKRVVSGSL